MKMNKLQRQFKVILEQDEDGYFVASVPALPGCHTQAKDLLELRERIKEAILLSLEVAETDTDYRRVIEEFAYQPDFVGIETINV